MWVQVEGENSLIIGKLGSGSFSWFDRFLNYLKGNFRITVRIV